MNEDLRARIQEHVVDMVEGGVSLGIMQMIDEAIENDYITQEEFQANEAQILGYVDDRIFECAGCGWTQPVCQMGEDLNGEFRCEDCDNED